MATDRRSLRTANGGTLQGTVVASFGLAGACRTVLFLACSALQCCFSHVEKKVVEYGEGQGSLRWEGAGPADLIRS
jgi:hypothetical protein